MANTRVRKRRTKAELEAAQKRREASRRYRLKMRHRMPVATYDALLEFQGGLCYICRRAKGTSRSLAVDHDHAIAKLMCKHPHQESCERCWRGLLCARCNDMLAHALDDPEMFRRAIGYLHDPPAPCWLVTQ